MGAEVALKLRKGPKDLTRLIEQYGCGPVQFAETDDALYRRHLLFDNVIDLAAAAPRDRFEAFARCVRDILSQRWVLTEKTYERENAKRVNYLLMEFLIGRSLANNITNLWLEAPLMDAARQDGLNWIELLEQEPDAGLGNGGMPTNTGPTSRMSLPGSGRIRQHNFRSGRWLIDPRRSKEPRTPRRGRESVLTKKET